eukprot:scaffold706_cov418-Prasinococcus_capsulatus_cf.AAC.28
MRNNATATARPLALSRAFPCAPLSAHGAGLRLAPPGLQRHPWRGCYSKQPPPEAGIVYLPGRLPSLPKAVM